MTFSKLAQKVIKYLGYFWKKICTRDLSKIAQSDRTGWLVEVPRIVFLLLFDAINTFFRIKPGTDATNLAPDFFSIFNPEIAANSLQDLLNNLPSLWLYNNCWNGSPRLLAYQENKKSGAHFKPFLYLIPSIRHCRQPR